MPAPRGTLTMKRKGDFTVTTYGKNHCGTTEKLDIKYELTVECSVSLDDRGFLFDQVNVDKFFKQIRMTKLSCEQFSIQCARKLWRLIKDENAGCEIHDMKLTLSPAPFAASMEFCYNSKRDGVKV